MMVLSQGSLPFLCANDKRSSVVFQIPSCPTARGGVDDGNDGRPGERRQRTRGETAHVPLVGALSAATTAARQSGYGISPATPNRVLGLLQTEPELRHTPGPNPGFIPKSSSHGPGKHFIKHCLVLSEVATAQLVEVEDNVAQVVARVFQCLAHERVGFDAQKRTNAA